MYLLDTHVLSELRTGKPQANALRAWFDEVRALFAGRTLPVDEAVVQRCVALHVPNPAPRHDALMAATALAHGLTLVTRNVQDFAGIGVELLNPWEQHAPETM